MLITIYKKMLRLGATVGWVKIGLGVLALGLGIWLAGLFFGSTPTSVATGSNTPAVTIISVRDLSAQTSPLSVVGTVTSKSEATVRAEKSGQVTAIYKELGDKVAAGTIVAEIENSSERAQLLQAQAGLDAAVASANVQVSTLGAAQDNAVTALFSAYAAVDNAVRGSTDSMFANPESTNPQFSVQSADSQAKINTEGIRIAVGDILNREHAVSSSLSASQNLAAEFKTTEAEVRKVRDYLDTLIRTLNAGIATTNVSEDTIAAYKAAASAARTSITGALSSLTAARQTLETAQKNSSSADASATSAALKQAQGAVAAARANYEKSVIRAPISGTINSLSLERGDYIQATTPVLTVANNGALEVVSYITENDASEVSVGGTIDIEGISKGVVTRVAPALDPITKKIEVHIGITSGASSFINGQSVTVHFTRTNSGTKNTPLRMIIPISALKVGTAETNVFTVDENNLLVAHPVVLGQLMGDRVAITQGIDFDTNIVVDARGLHAGQKVLVK